MSIVTKHLSVCKNKIWVNARIYVDYYSNPFLDCLTSLSLNRVTVHGPTFLSMPCSMQTAPSVI